MTKRTNQRCKPRILTEDTELNNMCHSAMQCNSPITSKMPVKTHSPLSHHTHDCDFHNHHAVFSRHKMSMEDDMDPYYFIKYLQTIPLPTSRLRNVLGEQTNAQQKTLVLDLDKTLVHCSSSPLPNADHTFSVNFGGSTFNIYAKCRPHLQEFLETVHLMGFEIVVFTASQSVYADRMLNIIDTKGRISKRLYRQNCTNVNGSFIKDLRTLGRDLRNLTIVDNSPHVFAYQIENGIPITSWHDDPHDTELLRLIELLNIVAVSDNVQDVLNTEFQLQEMIDAITIDEYTAFLRKL